MSAYQYVLTQWLQSGDRFVPVHEPTTQASQWGEFTNSTSITDCSSAVTGNVTGQYCSGQSNGVSTPKAHRTCPQDWLDSFLTPFFAGSLPSGITFGVTVNSKEMTSGSGGYYAAAFANSLSPVTDMGMDMYDFDSQRQTEYAATASLFQGNSTSGSVHNVFVEEFGPNAWTYVNGPSGESCAIVGLQSCTWNQFNQDFFASLLPFLSSLGITDASLYGTEVLGGCAPAYPDNPQDDNDVLYAATVAMENHQYSLAGTKLSSILAQWNKVGMQGCTLIGGSVP
jgi:hypothetical protein